MAKVLIIDDDAAMTDLLSLLLKSYGLEVTTINDSQGGIDRAKSESPDIILLDLMMPGKTGWDVCREIRTFSKVPIAVLSAIDDPVMVASALDAGADDYMVKPIPSGELLAHINNLTRRAVVEKDGGKTMIHQTDSLVKKKPLILETRPLQAQPRIVQ
ncbi:MAG: response regulator transcription factor [Anaerolineales bacterium]|jgi:DNA-binding response OmpR family regulator|nr:response regulator transcription factor [Anaerolineales bacterium]